MPTLFDVSKTIYKKNSCAKNRAKHNNILTKPEIILMKEIVKMDFITDLVIRIECSGKTRTFSFAFNETEIKRVTLMDFDQITCKQKYKNIFYGLEIN